MEPARAPGVVAKRVVLIATLALLSVHCRARPHSAARTTSVDAARAAVRRPSIAPVARADRLPLSEHPVEDACAMDLRPDWIDSHHDCGTRGVGVHVVRVDVAGHRVVVARVRDEREAWVDGDVRNRTSVWIDGVQQSIQQTDSILGAMSSSAVATLREHWPTLPGIDDSTARRWLYAVALDHGPFAPVATLSEALSLYPSEPRAQRRIQSEPPGFFVEPTRRVLRLWSVPDVGGARSTRPECVPIDRTEAWIEPSGRWEQHSETVLECPEQMPPRR